MVDLLESFHLSRLAAGIAYIEIDYVFGFEDLTLVGREGRRGILNIDWFELSACC
jgi:hypothetical protein